MSDSPSHPSQAAAAAPLSTSDAARFPYLAALNAAQREAVEALDGPVLVLAGAGTGKTRVLTTRLTHLLRTGRAVPGQVLAVTFTNKAAREMKERVSASLGGAPVEGWWLGTFHALAARMLRADAEKAGLKSNFTILDTDDQLRLIKQLMEAESIDPKRWPARALHSVIERWKDKGLTPDKVSAGEAGDFAGGRAVELYRLYQERLRVLNACDFGDLLLHMLSIFQAYPEVLRAYHRRFQYLLVDEYQDTNVAQYLWLRLLAQEHKNICCVGDDDQSIYGWRGAEVGNILRFETDFPGARVIRLERNYRSTQPILSAASGLIAKNEGRLGKTLWTEAMEGEQIRVRGLWDGEAEARFVGEEIEDLQRKGHKLSEIAILVRAGSQTREFEERFLTLGLPYRVVGGPRFYERLEIRDAIAYLRVIAQPDDDLAFERIVNKPKRGLGDATVKLLRQAARARGTSMLRAAAELVGTDEIKPAARRSLSDLLAQFANWRAYAQEASLPELVETVLDESGYVEMWRADKSIEAPGRLENLKELVSAVAEFENLEAFLEHIGLVMENLEGAHGDMVNVMTLHAAKGLEFDTVFLPGWEEGLFPNQRALDETGLKALEEERRLAYVGLTRARQRVVVSFAANRRMHGSWAAAIPSRFVDELPEDHVEVESDTGYTAGAAGTGWGGGWHDLGWGSGWTGAGQGRRYTGDAPRTTPGMARAERNRGRVQPFIETTHREVETLGGNARFGEGERVFHRKFGYGTVGRIEGERLTIAFDHAGQKKVMADFVVPADEAD